MDKQEKMFSKFKQPGNAAESVEQYEFEPIQGYPMLHWKGKRPFRSTQYYPAQLKETYGEPVDGWINRIYWGDNLQVMSHLLKEFRGKINLAYIDPPFDSNADYKRKISIKGRQLNNDHSTFEEKQYTDIWSNDEYLQFMYDRLILIRELLSSEGSIFLHCDSHKSHLLRCILDEVFGPNNFLTEIIWRRRGGKTSPDAKVFETVADSIFWYKKSENYIYNEQFSKQGTEDYVKKRFRYKDEHGRCFRLSPLNAPYPRPTLQYEYKGYKPHPNGWSVKLETMEEYDKAGKLFFPEDKNRRIQRKQYLDEWGGKSVQALWDDIPPINPQAHERLDYPTQKPEALMRRIIRSASSDGDLVFDCFMGSGTTQAAAMKLGRRFIGADINLGAIQISTKRLLALSREIINTNGQMKLDEDNTYYTTFSVYNVNHYDIFRNPVQAKDLLVEALEIQPIPHNTVYDGEKDGRMVKIMPINRIATRADLNELISNFDYKTFEKRKAEQPNKAVEKILLVCMGHELDLAGVLEKEAGYKLDIEVVDILRDKSNLEFKRDSEAVVITKNGNIEIQNFYPMNLLQKLSLMKENVEDWRELVESVMIDWDYDGETLRPAMTDIPGKKEKVKGTYPLPKHHGDIRIKITDLLSESWEGGVTNG